MEAQDALTEAVEWFLDHLRVERGASEHTLSAYAGDLAKACAFFAGHGVEAWPGLRNAHVLAFQTSLGPPVSPATALRRLSSLRSFIKFLKRRGVPVPADLPDTGGRRRPKSLPKALAAGERQATLAAPKLDSPPGLRDRALLELIYGAGLRVSEACELRLDQLALDQAAVVVTGKRGKTRWVPLPGETIAWLERYLAEARPKLQRRPSARVLLSDRGLPLCRQTAYRRVALAARAAGRASGVGPHTLRHTYAVDLLKGGADLRAVQELLGHESIATTQVYTQLDLEEVARRYREAHPRR